MPMTPSFSSSFISSLASHRLWLVLLCLLVAALSWRFAPLGSVVVPVLAMIAGVTAVILSWMMPDQDGDDSHHSHHSHGAHRFWATSAIASFGGLIAVLGLVPSLWPCEISCQGLNAWRHLLGIDLYLIGAMGLLTIAGLSAWSAQAQHNSH